MGKKSTCYQSGKFLCVFLMMILSVSALSTAQAQNTDKIKVSGIVTDDRNEPLIGVNVVQLGTENGSITDMEGRFELMMPPQATIEVYYTGFVQQQIPVEGRTSLEIRMQKDIVLLKDLVVIGYATGSQQSISGAVQKIDRDEMNTGVVNSPLSALQGRVAGLNIQTSSNPTANPTIRIRGTTSLSGGNDPLVVIDGVMSDLSMLNTLSPSDIESYTILKDASETAQYGSRGASGVIVVTTQRGKYGKRHLSYDGTFGLQTVAKRTHSLSATEYRQAAQDRGVPIIDGGSDTDFFDEILQMGYTQNHKISFGKGDEESNYNVSMGIIDQKGIIKTTFKQQFNIKIDVAQSFFDNKLKLETGVFGSRVKGRGLTDERNTFNGAITMNPTYPNTPNEDGSWPSDPVASEVYNPLDLLTTEQIIRNYDAMVHARATWTIVDGLKLSAFGSITVHDADTSVYLPINSRPGKLANGGRGEKRHDRRENYLSNIGLNYVKTMGKHYLNALALFEGQQYKDYGSLAASSRYSTDYHGSDNLEGGAIINYGDVSSYRNEFTLISFLARINYVYGGRYIATINMREDGSSKLGRNNKWGFFPSFSFAWNVMNESFMSDRARFMDELKLRVSYGVAGNQDAIAPYNSLQLMGTSDRSLVTIDGSPTVAYTYLRNANPDLRWETKKTFDVGFDLALFNRRVSLIFDYYNSVTDDLLYTYSVPQPPFTYNQLLANIGSMKNQGVELTLGYAAIAKKDIGLDLSANFTWQKNVVTSLTGTYNGQSLTPSAYVKLSSVHGAGIQGYNDVLYMFEGQPLGVFYLPKTDGLVEANGQNTYNILDLNGDGVVNIANGEDRYFAGQATPKYLMGVNIKFRFKQFDIQTQLNGAFGHKIYNGTAMSLGNMQNFPGYNLISGSLERNIYDSAVTDYWLESGDYVNIAYVTLGYTLNTGRYLKGLRLVRFTASVNNLHTFTNYSGMSPMINSTNLDRNGNTFGNDDKRFYPVARIFSFGVSVHF